MHPFEPIRTVTIAGVGLIGGSFALAIRKAGFTGRILGVSSPATIAEALSRGAIDAEASFEDGIHAADLIYLARPISQILNDISRLAPLLPPHALVTDAGSTKAAIAATAAEFLPPGRFLGGHPMAGKESRGVAAADPDLFRGRPYIVTPTALGAPPGPLTEAFLAMLQGIGSHVITLDPGTHDRSVARISHLPQLASTALAAAICPEGSSTQVLELAGPGLNSMARLALSSFDLWKDILATNQSPITAVLDEYILVLQELRNHLLDSPTEQTFARGAEVAKRLRRQR